MNELALRSPNAALTEGKAAVEEAYVLLKISREVYVRGVVNECRELAEVEEAEILFGEYDALLKVKGDRIHDLENLVVDRISRIPGVEATLTMVCVPEEVLE